MRVLTLEEMPNGFSRRLMSNHSKCRPKMSKLTTYGERARLSAKLLLP